jgi:chromosome segregation protein
LRAPTGLDVLFGGSDSRPPAGVCEVELVLDNECGTLPIEFNEVSVMRRLYRDGESEYYLNRAKVRRLDVMELLSDARAIREMADNPPVPQPAAHEPTAVQKNISLNPF